MRAVNQEIRIVAQMPRKKTNEEFIKDVFNLVGNEYSVLQEYSHSNVKILFKHNLCGHEWSLTPHNFLRGNRCPNCANKSRSNKLKDTNEEFLIKFKNLVKDEYDVLSTYNGQREYIEIVHNICNHKYKVYPQNFIRGDRCPKCAGNLSKSTEQVKKELDNLTDGEYSLESEYINYHTKVTIKHNVCGNTYEVKPSNFFHNGRRCPICKESKGEKEVSKVLKSINLKFERQYTFDDCKNKRKLPFDFAVFDNDKLLFLIEYQGVQHYKKNEFFGKNNFERTRNNDLIKFNYCKDNAIKLILIPYWEFNNIEKIIENALKEVRKE